MMALLIYLVLTGSPRGGVCDMPTTTPAGVQRVIACAVARWPVPGGLQQALSVAKCESGFRPRAEYRGHIGIYQHRDIYWMARWRKWGAPHDLSRDPHNARSNIIVSIRMAHEAGWGAWSCR